jgi:outer membrane protein TolC
MKERDMIRRIAMLALALTLLVAGMPAAPVPKVDPTAKLDAATREKIHKLQVERRDALKRAAECRWSEFEAGRGMLETLLEVSRRLLKAELELATTKEQRIAAHADLLKVARQIDEITTARYEAGRVKEADHQEARAARLEAEIGWLKAGGGKEKKEKRE